MQDNNDNDDDDDNNNNNNNAVLTGTISPFHRNRFFSLTSMFLKIVNPAAFMSWSSWKMNVQPKAYR